MVQSQFLKTNLGQSAGLTQLSVTAGEQLDLMANNGKPPHLAAEMEADPCLSSPGFSRTLAANASTNRHTLPEDLGAVGI